MSSMTGRELVQAKDAARRFNKARRGGLAAVLEERAVVGGLARRIEAAPVEAQPASQERRKEWLARGLADERARSAVAEAVAHGSPASPAATLATLAQERILGRSDLVGTNYLELALSIARGVCRIRVGSAAGTGFLVGPGVLMTNNHVLETADAAAGAVAQFDYQENVSGELLPVHAFALRPDELFLTDRPLDFTLVAVAPVSNLGRSLADYPWTKLIGNTGKAVKGDPVNIIQHPRGGLKQVALRNNEVLEIPPDRADFLFYSTDTEPGSSGSPCFNDQWELIALHHSGVPATDAHGNILRKGGGAWRQGQDDPSLVDWIANEGVRVSAIVGRLSATPHASQAGHPVRRLLEEAPPNPIELARKGSPAGAPAGPVAAAAPGHSVSFTMPLTVTISLGGAPQAPAAVSPGTDADRDDRADDRPAPRAAEPAEALRIDPDWSAREGYLTGFLGVDVPLPVLSGELEDDACVMHDAYVRPGREPYVLDYHHYSVVMSRTRRFAIYSAAMVDGDRRRFELPKRRDRWFVDPRIERDGEPQIQCGEELYAAASTDRGHLTRYLDVTWGEDLDEALLAAADTFHFTNCTLQLSDFNQSRERWQGIERFLLEEKARREKRRLVVITGPLFERTDPLYRNSHMDGGVRIPLQFWKACALVRRDGSLSACGFLLGQEDVAELPGFEEFDASVAQVTLADLESWTGLDFGVMTRNDHFAQGGAPGTLEADRGPGGKRRLRVLRDPSDVVA